MENGQQEGMMPDEKQEKEPTFNDQLSEAIEQNIVQFLQGGLEEADKRIRSQNEQIQTIQEQQLEFRDEIAVRVFVPLIDKVDSFDKAASDAYRAADSFLRARETGL